MIILNISKHSIDIKATLQNQETYSDIIPHGGKDLYHALVKKYSSLRKITTEKIVISYNPGDKRKSITCTINSDVKPPSIDKYKNIPNARYIPDKLVTLCANNWIVDKNGDKKYITDRVMYKRKINRAETLLDLFYTGQIDLLEFRTKLNKVIDA